LYLFY